MKKKKLITSPFRRAAKLGNLFGRVGTSMIYEKSIGVFRSNVSNQIHKADNLIRNATRIADTLGSLKGGAMKVGQMLSLHDGLFPPEVTQVLSKLQKQAPPIDFQTIDSLIRKELMRDYQIFEYIEEDAFAAASIGQVHKGKLRDGTDVAIKVQYPSIDKIIKADIKNLKNILGKLFSLFTKMDFTPVWEELKQRLLEEIDYKLEANNIKKARQLYKDTSEIIIPDVISQATTSHVLTMEYIEGISPDIACSEKFDQETKDKWGQTLYKTICKGLFKDKFLHVDPNLANFSFLEDNKIILYDFGCMKQIPEYLITSYKKILNAFFDQKYDSIPFLLKEMGVFYEGGYELEMELISPYIEIFEKIYKDNTIYQFGIDNIYERLIEIGMANFYSSLNIHFPKDVIFINRTFGGHFGNLRKLRATGYWKDVLMQYV